MAEGYYVFAAASVATVTFYKVLDRIVRIPYLRNLDQKYIFITGCDSGFGQTTAKHLDSLGLHVIAGCFTIEGRKFLESECSERLKTVQVDITDPDSIERAYIEIKKHVPQDKGLWGVLNNAGTTGDLVGPPTFFRVDDYRKVFDVNVLGMVEVNRVLLPLVKKAKGRIVNTASIGGRFANPLNPAYAVSKFAVEGYSDAIRRELRPFGVSVHIIEPAAYESGFTPEHLILEKFNRAWDRQPPAIKEEYGQQYAVDIRNNDMKVFRSNISTKSFDVTKAYTHALIGRNPRGRYLVPGINGRILWFMSLLPEWMSDAMLEMGVKNRAIPAVCKKK